MTTNPTPLKDHQEIERKKKILDEWPIRGLIVGVLNKGGYDIEGRLYCSLEEKEAIVKEFVFYFDHKIKRL